MENKLQEVSSLLQKGYRMEFEKPAINIPGTFKATFVMTSPEGAEKRFEFEGMEVSLAEGFYYDHLSRYQ